jgi:hypothetical protein
MQSISEEVGAWPLVVEFHSVADSCVQPKGRKEIPIVAEEPLSELDLQ